MSALAQVTPRPVDYAAARGEIGAVVVGGDYQGLGIVRSLGRKGVPVCVVDDERSIARHSRYSTSFARASNLRDDKVIVSHLIEVGRRRRFDGWVLYPTRDELVAAISRHRTELSDIFRVPTPGWESVRWAWDKRNTYELAQKLGIPVPVTHYPETAGELSRLADRNPPFVLKPAIKEHFIYATKAKAWRADSHTELKTLFEEASALAGMGEIMIQELIPGGGSQQFSYCAFFRDGQAVGTMVACRRRQHPLEFGRASTYVETVDIPILEELSTRFLRAINYYGLVELEFKLDPRDSQYKLLDVNARTWGYHSLGERAGVDFSYMLYSDQVGLPVATCRSRPGLVWVRTTTDVPAALMAILKGDISVRGYLQSMKVCNTEAVFSVRDPLPGLAEMTLLPYLIVKKGF